MDPSEPAPLSKTCQNCADTKVRCSRNNPPPCDRCHRLGKECVYRKARRRFNGIKKDVRIEALEAKINELLSKDNNTPSPNSQSGTSGISPTQEPESAKGRLSAASHERPSPAPFYTSSPHGFPDIVNDIVDSGLISLQTANSLLEKFKTTMTPHFPFVVVAPEVTAERLRLEKPFLFMAIMAAASYEMMPLQRRLGRMVAQTVSSRVILAGEVSFDLLQGLLVHLAWCQYHSRPRRYTQFLQVAIGILVELRLDCPPQKQSWKSGLTFDGGNPLLRQGSWETDEQRAVVGCFYLSSTISALLQKQSTFLHTLYIDECCKSVCEMAEYGTDKYLPYIVQLQLIIEKIDRLSAQHYFELHNSMGSGAELYVTTIKSELDNFHMTLPFPLKENSLLFMQLHSVELCLYQISLFERPRETHSSTEPSIFLSSFSKFRLELLRAGLMSASSFFNYYLSLPIGVEMSFNNSEMIQIGFALIVAAKQTLAAMGESLYQETVPQRRLLDMSTILARVVERTRALSTPLVDDDGDVHTFVHFEKRALRLQSWYEGHFARDVFFAPLNDVGGSGSLTVSALLEHGTTTSPYAQHLAADSNIHNLTSNMITDINSEMALADPMVDYQYIQYFSDLTVSQFMSDWMTQPMYPLS
ncbi:hypothetical protein GX50_07444 [[Emmonsia] crescens]|uniref:Zn(2)-C6 fungal-type domain-containing protein n=1 Tax=[Emmonsia] crescens TaxID=73230 RepID=A0A2B7Z887_9EURO|nr:hypothetical protein GX50_07444 [Emmonsia crescens]